MTRKSAEMEVSNFAAWRLAAPKHLVDQVAPQAQADRANKWGNHHHITLLSSKELQRLKSGGKSPLEIHNAFQNAKPEDMSIADDVRHVQAQGRTYQIADVNWPGAQAVRKELGLGKGRLHVTLGVKFPTNTEAHKYAAFRDELSRVLGVIW